MVVDGSESDVIHYVIVIALRPYIVACHVKGKRPWAIA
jgi:hypothetical protein